MYASELLHTGILCELQVAPSVGHSFCVVDYPRPAGCTVEYVHSLAGSSAWRSQNSNVIYSLLGGLEPHSICDSSLLFLASSGEEIPLGVLLNVIKCHISVFIKQPYKVSDDGPSGGHRT